LPAPLPLLKSVTDREWAHLLHVSQLTDVQ
jgi:hypothetical protein